MPDDPRNIFKKEDKYSFMEPGQPMMKTIFEWLMVLVGFAVFTASIFGILELIHKG